MQTNGIYKVFSILLIFFSFFSFFLGFHLDENSAGAGSYIGDIIHSWKNVQLFLSNDLINSIKHPDYFSNRTPLLYILHENFNPFTKNIESYRKSVFAVSLIAPLLLFFCLKQKFRDKDNILLLLISSIIFLSPYYRTSSYWGLEENYGIICLLLSFLFLNIFLNNKNKEGHKLYIQLFLLTFFSSCCLYFDQKLIIIPTICFLKIATSDKLTKVKVLSIFYYLILSLPYIYLITLWESLIPPLALDSNHQSVATFGVKGKIYWEHIGYASTIIAFYLLPILLFKKKNLFNLIKDFALSIKSYYLVLLFFTYLFYLIFFFEYDAQSFIGKGYIHKVSIILFNDIILREIFTYLSFFISWTIIIIYAEKNFKDFLIIFYFFALSINLMPLLQEYFDPIVLLIVFTFFNTKLFISYKNSIILYLYLLILLVGSNIYYTNML